MRALLVTVAILAGAAPAAADDNGAYGRFDGDLTLEADLGGGAAFEGDAIFGTATLELRARYLDSVGIVLGGEFRYQGTSRVWIGADFRPIFLGRFLTDNSFHDRFWDLLVDSIGIDLGVGFLPLDERVGAALIIGFGIDIPMIFFGTGIDGLALRLAGRHAAALETDRFGPAGGANDWLAMAAIVLRATTNVGLAAWEPPRYEMPDE
jgi:hypothetical protein